MNTAFTIDELDRQVSGAAAAVLDPATGRFITNGDRLIEDVLSQIKGVDAEAQIFADTTGNPNARLEKRLAVRRAAILVLNLTQDPRLGLIEYTGMLTRGEGAPHQSQIIAGFKSILRAGLTVLKAYGEPHPNEALFQRLLTDDGVEGVVNVYEYGEHPLGSWLTMELLRGKSLTAIWHDGKVDRPVNPGDALPVTENLALLMSKVHGSQIAKPPHIPTLAEQLQHQGLGAFAGFLSDNGYSDFVQLNVPDVVDRISKLPNLVPSHGDLFGANIMIDGDNITVIDPNPAWAPREYDAAVWLSHTGEPRKGLGPITQAWLNNEPGLDPNNLALCMAFCLWRHAAILEVVKREVGEDWGPRDNGTIGMLEAANSLYSVATKRQIATPSDLVSVLNSVSSGIQPGGPEISGRDLPPVG